MIRDFLFVSKSILKELVESIIYAVACNLKNISSVINLVLPFICFYLGRYSLLNLLIVSIIILFGLFLSYFTKQFANKIGKGETCPVPTKRFTEKTDDGEVSIEVDRLQELTLYMADLEDWLESKGIVFQ